MRKARQRAPTGARAFSGDREITVRNERIIVLQMTGPATAKAYSFNHVNLGDSTQTLTQYFGAPFRVVKSELPDTDEWSYPPWPFSFEVKAGRVTSMRINDPAQSN